MCLDNAFPVELSCFPAISATQELFSPCWYVTPPPLTHRWRSSSYAASDLRLNAAYRIKGWWGTQQNNVREKSDNVPKHIGAFPTSL
jgi:hypothetical protein